MRLADGASRSPVDDYAKLPTLLPSQLKNLDEKVVKASGLDRQFFRWEVWDTAEGRGAALVFDADRYFLVLRPQVRTEDGTQEQSKYYVCEYAPGRKDLYETHGPLEFGRWSVMRLSEKWATYLLRELDALEWFRAAYTTEAVFKRHEDPSVDERFSVGEQKVLSAQLDRIERELIERNRLDDAHAGAVHAEFQELKRELQQLKRSLWLRLAAGSLVQLAIRHVISMPEAGAVLEQIMHVVQVALDGLTLGPGG